MVRIGHRVRQLQVGLMTQVGRALTAGLARQLTLNVAAAHVALMSSQEQQSNNLVGGDQVGPSHEVCVQRCQALQGVTPAHPHCLSRVTVAISCRQAQSALQLTGRHTF